MIVPYSVHECQVSNSLLSLSECAMKSVLFTQSVH